MQEGLTSPKREIFLLLTFNNAPMSSTVECISAMSCYQSNSLQCTYKYALYTAMY